MYDLDNDCHLLGFDWALFAGCWLQCPGDPGYATGLNGESCDAANYVGFCDPDVSSCCTSDNCVGPEDFPFMWGALQEANQSGSNCGSPFLKLPLPCTSGTMSALDLPTNVELKGAGLAVPAADWKGYDRGILKEAGARRGVKKGASERRSR